MKKILFSTAIIGAMCFAQINVKAQSSADFDKLVNQEFPTQNENGAAILVVRKGEILYRKGVGMANIELGVSVKPEMVFRVGSITKQFTAVAILKLVEQGKLSLQDELTKFIPDYPTQGNKITVEHLLTHTSGIKSFTSLSKYQLDAHGLQKDMSPLEMINMFKNEPMDFPVGTKFMYNNSAYFLLGYIIEKASGKTYQEYLQENLFKPLDLQNTYYDKHNFLIKNRVNGYHQGDKGLENEDYISLTQPYAAGALVSSVDDLYKWYKGIHEYKIVKKELLDKAFTSYKLPDGKDTKYGYGWFLASIAGSPTHEHGGAIHGFLAQSIYLPKEEVFVAVLSNCTCKSPDDLAVNLAALTIGKSMTYKTIPVNTKDLEVYTGVYDGEDGGERVITLEGNQLYSQRIGGPKLKIMPYEKDKFTFEGMGSVLHFTRNKENKIVSAHLVTRLALGITWTKTDKLIPAERKTIDVAESVLDTYLGQYEMQPNVLFTVTREGKQLKVQLTGQPAAEVFPETETKFFLKVVPAQVEFLKDEQGKVKSIMLYQGGQKIESKKVK